MLPVTTGLEFGVRSSPIFGEDRGIELLADSGLQVSNLLWAGGFTGSDGRGYDDSVADGVEAIELAAAMRADCLVVYSGARDGHIYNHARRMTRNALKELLPVAESLGVTLAVEPVHPRCGGDWTFLHSLDDALELIASIQSPYLKLAFDTYHLGQAPLCLERVRLDFPGRRYCSFGRCSSATQWRTKSLPLGRGLRADPRIGQCFAGWWL